MQVQEEAEMRFVNDWAVHYNRLMGYDNLGRITEDTEETFKGRFAISLDLYVPPSPSTRPGSAEFKAAKRRFEQM